jgi:hypothetical protein
MAKYDGLAEHLARIDGDQYVVELRMGEIDRLCGGLPPSATRLRTWWGNGSQVQAQAWRGAGWHVDAVDLSKRVVRFARGHVGGSYAARKGTGTPPQRKPAITPPGDVTGSVQAAVRFEWRDRGAVTRAGGLLSFPRLPSTPGLYRLELTGGSLSRPQVYIGETGDLRQRMSNYRRPPTRAQTSVRINALLLEHLADRGTVQLSTCEEVVVGLPEQERAADLSLRRERLLAENAALLIEAEHGGYDLANL